ncbi:thioredoxin domain-containing protein [Candidatus Peregrinibacteria bacterium]|nr:thioredoxin domain-containing protein [Candidatus Peregrinibacteria bacterium]
MNPHHLGNSDAKVLIEVFSDPQCPACGIIVPQAEEMVRENPDLARFDYYHFPLSYHPYAFIAAEASECAGDQGKFFDYLNTLYANQSSISEDYLYNVADSLNLDRSKFDVCLENHEFKDKIMSQLAEGTRRGLPGTPTFYVNGQQVRWNGVDTFKAYLESL